MLVVYSKSTGRIQGVFSGDLQSIDTLYGEDAEDFKIIWDELALPDDVGVIRNPEKFIVNTETKELELLPEYAFNPQNYKVAKKSELINTKEGDEDGTIQRNSR
jgi:hypothetical protein